MEKQRVIDQLKKAGVYSEITDEKERDLKILGLAKDVLDNERILPGMAPIDEHLILEKVPDRQDGKEIPLGEV